MFLIQSYAGGCQLQYWTWAGSDSFCAAGGSIAVAAACLRRPVRRSPIFRCKRSVQNHDFRQHPPGAIVTLGQDTCHPDLFCLRNCRATGTGSLPVSLVSTAASGRIGFWNIQISPVVVAGDPKGISFSTTPRVGVLR
jgi:hypothetical protein